MKLAHALVTHDSGTPSRWVLFLHGIFGSGANWRTIARRYVAARPDVGAVLVDLRMHGRSQGFAAPHTLAAAAADLDALDLPGPVAGVVAHSFGGKVALEWVRARAGDLDDAFILDATPGVRDADAPRGSEGTVRVLEVLESLPPIFASRDAFHRALSDAGLSNDLVAWLAMNVDATEGGYRFRLDLAAIRALLRDYFAHDLWPVVESPPGRVNIHLVIGGASTVFDEVDRERARRAAAAHPSRVSVDVLGGAGHWVHVDAPDALFRVLTRV